MRLLTERDERSRLALQLERVRTDLAVRDSTIAAFLGPEVHVVSLSPTGEKPSMRVFWNHTRNIFIVTAFNVPRAPDGKTYQLWAIRKGQQPLSMGTFNTDATGRATAILAVANVITDGGFIDLCGLTMEPAGGSSQPSETPRLVGSWRHTD
jgi:anti-sigma-K factor RskA